MANINITSEAWTVLPITSGTVQNISANTAVEINSEQTDDTGIVIPPYGLYSWDSKTVYARAIKADVNAAIRTVNFKKSAGGGGGGGYVLPIASASELGGVKIGSNLSIDESGVLSAPVSYSTTEQVIGTWIDGKPICQKTVQITLPSTTGEQAYSYLPEIPFSNIDTLVKIEGYVISSSGWRISYGHYENGNTFLGIDWNKTDGKLWIYVSNMTGSQPATLTFRYTKTAD